MPRLAWVALAVGVLVVLLPLARAIVRHTPKLAATNTHVIGSRNVVGIAPGTGRCQWGEYVPRSAATLKVYAGVVGGGGPPLAIRLETAAGRTVARARVAGGYRTAPLLISLPPRSRSLQIGHLCIRNLGSRPIYFAGNLVSDQPDAPTTYNTPYERPTDEVRADYLLAGRPSYLSIAPEVARRSAMYRPPFLGPWFFWFAIAVMVTLVVAGISVAMGAMRR